LGNSTPCLCNLQCLIFSLHSHQAGGRNSRGLWPDRMSDSKTILVIDDDPYILDVVALFLKTKGVHVLSTTDPEKAYSMAESEKPDLIISDIAMPGLDGFTLCKGFKQNSVTHDIPVVMLTGSDKLADVETGFASGVRAYLVKPIDWASAWPKIQALL
jgi:DNA-binding response OmpR family regulator